MPELTWQDVWRAMARHYSLTGLEALAVALSEDSPELIEDQTTDPLVEGPCVGACAGAFPLWKDGLVEAADVEFAFGELANVVNCALASRAGCKRPIAIFTNDFWDDMFISRKKKCRQLLALVGEEIARRKGAALCTTA